MEDVRQIFPDPALLGYVVQTRREIDNEKKERDQILNFLFVTLGGIGVAAGIRATNASLDPRVLATSGAVVGMALLALVLGLMYIRCRKLYQIADRWIILDSILRLWGGRLHEQSLERAVSAHLRERPNRYKSKDIYLNRTLSGVICAGIFSLFLTTKSALIWDYDVPIVWLAAVPAILFLIAWFITDAMYKPAFATERSATESLKCAARLESQSVAIAADHTDSPNLRFVLEVCQREVLSQRQSLEALNLTIVGLIAVEVGLLLFVLEQLRSMAVVASTAAGQVSFGAAILFGAVALVALAMQSRRRRRPDLQELADGLRADSTTISDSIEWYVQTHRANQKFMGQKERAILISMTAAGLILLVYIRATLVSVGT